MQYDENAEKYGYEGEMTLLKCDELKAYKGDVYIPVYGSIADADVYLKKDADTAIAELKDVIHELQVDLEADKVIAELRGTIAQLEDDCAYWKTMSRKCADDNEVMAKQRAEAFKKERHQKYKRCLAMAQEWRSYATFCGIQSSWHNNRGFGKTAEKYTWKECHAWTCVKRWMELAERFKEGI